MKVRQASLDKLDFARVRQALAERTACALGSERVQALSPSLSRAEAEQAWRRIAEALAGPEVSLGGVHDIRSLLEDVHEGMVQGGKDILAIAYTLDAASTIKRAILASERPELCAIAELIGHFDGSLRLVREQLDADGNVRDDATPKLRDIRRRLNPLRGRIRDKLQQLLERYGDAVQDAIITLRRDRYVIPIKASAQSRVPGIALDQSDSGATVFIEPQSVVPLNNELAILEFEERDEVRRILLALGQRLAYEPELEATLEQLALLDVVAASAKLCRDWQLQQPSFNDQGRIELRQARHPLIENCVPNDIVLEAERRLLVITGPNAGGKTVLLKTLGLAALMAHSGLFVASARHPAPTLPYSRALLSDIGDQQSIEASLSTYAGHLQNLKRIADEADEDVLVLIDELGSGTDPAEGAALSQALIERILASGAKGLINTHLAPLKAFASDTPGLQNAAMQFDVAALRPKYQLVVGQPGRSYALAIAERLGLPAEILQRAADILGPEGERLESLLEQLEQQRQKFAQENVALEQAKQQALDEAALLRQHIDNLRQQQDSVLAAAAQKAENVVQDTLRRAKELKRTASSDPQKRSQALSELQQLRQEVQAQNPKPAKKKRAAPQGARLQRGAMVHVPSYDASGPIAELRDDEAVVQLGLLKVTVPKHELRLVKEKDKDKADKPSSDKATRKKAKYSSAHAVSAPTHFERELNIRGERVEAGLEKVRDFVLEAQALKIDAIRILHGKGTGALRDAVRNYLKDDRRVERYEDAVPYEGGHGVTVAYIRFG